MRSQLGAQPCLEGISQRPALLLPHEATFLRAAAADLLLDRIECGDVLQCLARDRSGAGCREFVEVAPHVHPAEVELDLATFGKLWVGVVAIDLQDVLEAGKMAEQPLGFAVGCIDIGDAWRFEAAPGPVVGGIAQSWPVWCALDRDRAPAPSSRRRTAWTSREAP